MLDVPLFHCNLLGLMCKNYFDLVAPYFIDCISEADLDEMNIEIIRNTLYKVSPPATHLSVCLQNVVCMNKTDCMQDELTCALSLFLFFDSSVSLCFLLVAS